MVIFGVFTWGNIHLGYQNLALYLTVGPLALVAITTALLKLFSSKYPRVIAQIGRPLFSILNILVKPISLVLLLLVVIGLFVMFSSVRIDHREKGPLKAKLLSPEYQSVKHWRVDANNPDQTRLLALINPATRRHLLSVEGYQEKSIQYTLFDGIQLHLDSLDINPAIIARIPRNSLSLKKQLYLELLRDGKLYLDHAPFGNSGSVFVGNTDLVIPTELIERWEQELAGVERSLADKVIGLWKNSAHDTTQLHYGDKLTLSLKQARQQGDTILFTTQIELKNNNNINNITDVLLH
jgi:hypothetical protein